MNVPVLTARRRERARRSRLAAGQSVALLGRMRRTTTRGWGPWTDGSLLLGALPVFFKRNRKD